MRSLKRSTVAVAALFATVVTLVVLAPPASAAETTITSAGPLDEIILGDLLNCQVANVADPVFEFYDPDDRNGACTTQIRTGGATYGPDIIPAGNNPTPFTAVSQSAVTGDGSATSPYTVVTVVDVTGTALRITQTDSYVVGTEQYRTDVEVENSSGGAIDATVYRAGDCYLQGSDFGFGSTTSTPNGTAVACVGSDDGGATPNSRIEQWYPLTAGSDYVEGFYDDVWELIQAGTPFPNTSEDDVFQDNGAGLSWDVTVPANGSTTVSHLTQFAPLGVSPISIAKTADAATSAPGATNGYEITVTSTNVGDTVLDSITDVLPAGFTYTAGSTDGGVTVEPTTDGQALTWSGPFIVPGGGALTFRFDVTVSGTPGTYYNEVTAIAQGVAVTGTGPTAPVEVAVPAVVVAPAPVARAVAATPAFTG